MIAFGVIGFLIMVLVYFVTKNQSMSRELKQVQSTHKTLQSQNKYALNIMLVLSSQLQHSFRGKLANMQNHGLLNHKDFEMASFILENFQYVITQCCQHNETVEVAVKKSLKGQHITIEDVSKFIAKQPAEVKVPWCKNSVEGYVAACRNLVAQKASSEVTESEQIA